MNASESPLRCPLGHVEVEVAELARQGFRVVAPRRAGGGGGGGWLLHFVKATATQPALVGEE